MRMTPEAFHIWSQRLQFTSETEALSAALGSSPRVSGQANTISRRSPSPNMQCFIHFASEQVEFCALTEVHEVLSSQRQEAEVSCVACPTGLAVRDLHPKGELVKVPWPAKRVTSPPHHWLVPGEARKRLDTC
jgi:hypothetical protein